MSAVATAEERAAVDALLGPPETGWVGGARDGGVETRFARGGRAARDRRDLLLPALHALQSGVGWISEGGLNYVCQRLTVPPAEAYGVATFYAMFSVEPRPRTVVHVCDDLACRLGGDALCAPSSSGPPARRTWAGPTTVASWVRSPCLGMCERAPAVLVQRAGGAQDDAFGRASAAQVRSLLADATHEPEFARPNDPAVVVRAPDLGHRARSGLRLLRRVGVVDPSSIDDYRAHGGYEALRRAHALGPVDTIREITDARLMGRGGAAFPTGVKWKAVAEQPCGRTTSSATPTNPNPARSRTGS